MQWRRTRVALLFHECSAFLFRQPRFPSWKSRGKRNKSFGVRVTNVKLHVRMVESYVAVESEETAFV